MPSVFSGDDNLALPHGLLDLFLKLLTWNTGLGQQDRQKEHNNEDAGRATHPFSLLKFKGSG